MPIPVERVLIPETVHNFGHITNDLDLPSLTQIQTESYAQFLQVEKSPKDRRNQGLEEVLRRYGASGPGLGTVLDRS